MVEIVPTSEVNVSCLARIFWNTTNSYKYLFFLALLDLVADDVADKVRFRSREVVIGMLAWAWYPHFVFRLSFGTADQIPEFLGGLALSDMRLRTGFDRNRFNRLKKEIRECLPVATERQILRYVPTRILRVFFEEKVRGEPEWVIDRRIKELAQSEFETARALFKIEGTEIVFNETWVAYLRKNIAIVRDWALWEWLQYMQARNPNTPSIARKLVPAAERGTLTLERKFWRMVIEHAELRCIYSDGLLLNDFAVDQFLPWAFVAHDRVWNLVPCDPAVNSGKGDRVPSERYLSGLVNAHVVGLCVWRELLSDGAWRKRVEPYVADLNVPFGILE